ncbi:hypothetical protein [Kribbella deserti]|uniref:MFS transporter n=1 Tax=Kribbella deserti TaxID=1926257 RepID=A0ABV6QLA7_9ACTN
MRPGPGVRRTALAAGVGVAVAGGLAGVLVLGPFGSLLLLAIVFVLVWPAALVVRSVTTETAYGPPLLVAAIAAGGVLALPGLIRLLTWGALGWLFAICLALFAILLDWAIRRRARRRPDLYATLPSRLRPGGDTAPAEQSSTAGPAGAKAVDDAEPSMSVGELCRIWRESGQALRRAHDAHDRETIAEVRRLCLNELERLNPEGFRRWLDAGAPSDPGTFLLRKSD